MTERSPFRQPRIDSDRDTLGPSLWRRLVAWCALFVRPPS